MPHGYRIGGGLMETKLKPCPFCGSTEVKIILYGGLDCIACTRCPGNVMVSQFQTKQEAIEAWNRRAEDGNQEQLHEVR